MTIYEHYQKGDLLVSFQKKVIKNGIERYCEIFFVFSDYRKTKGYDESVELTAETCCTSERTVKRAISTVTK